jgi:alkylated DNA repair dioxygenase AlkB
MTLDEQEDTDTKLATLASIFENIPTEDLLEALLNHDGQVDATVVALSSRPAKRQKLDQNASVKLLLKRHDDSAASLKRKPVLVSLSTKEQIESSPLPCTLLLNVLPVSLANALLQQMLNEGVSWEKGYFKLFDRTVTSPHVSCFYLPSKEDVAKHVAYAYNGQPLSDIRVFPKEMTQAHSIINEATDAWMHRNGHLQQDEHWQANVAFSNLYDGRHSSVGYHSDQLTYLGPSPCIASLSLGVTREFRLKPTAGEAAVSTTYAVKLPHNSLFIMGPHCQEDYKHSLSASPNAGLDRHAIAGKIRINITYRQYRSAFSPEKLHRCACGVQVVLRCAAKASAPSTNAMKKEPSAEGAQEGWFRGRRYFWHCDGDKRPGRAGCGYFAWAQLDANGDPT